MAEEIGQPSSETKRLLKREWQPMLHEKRLNEWKSESLARGISVLPTDHFPTEMVMDSRTVWTPFTGSVIQGICMVISGSHPLKGWHLNDKELERQGRGPSPAQTLKISVVACGLWAFQSLHLQRKAWDWASQPSSSVQASRPTWSFQSPWIPHVVNTLLAGTLSEMLDSTLKMKSVCWLVSWKFIIAAYGNCVWLWRFFWLKDDFTLWYFPEFSASRSVKKKKKKYKLSSGRKAHQVSSARASWGPATFLGLSLSFACSVFWGLYPQGWHEERRETLFQQSVGVEEALWIWARGKVLHGEF